MFPGRPAANEAMATVAAPLFAGFSVTLIGVIAQDTDKFLLPGVAMFLLALAAICFMIALQSGFQARLYLTTPADIVTWHPEYQADPAALEAEKPHQRLASKGYRAWEARTARYYSFGLIGLLFGLAATIAPPLGTAQATWRWVGVGAVGAMILLEAFWSFAGTWWLRHDTLVRTMHLEPLFVAWFKPARRLDAKEQAAGQDGTAHA